jgi:tetratricopeptide (TPR) repeat protein
MATLDDLKAALADRYQLQRELGQGGMATVYLATDLKHNRQVAVKVLKPELQLGADRFLREITIAAQLQHPHILPLFDSGEDVGLLWYAMPFVQGESLRAKLDREGELPIGEATKILREVTDAMAKAHSAGVVHRDIKPDNVMLADGHAIVMDFGVAKAVSEATGKQSVTTAGVALGTPAYMAPEQAAADPHIDHRADLYALGAMAYEMLCGRPPFVAPTPQAVLAAHVTTAPEDVTRSRETAPPQLSALVMKCLEKKPADRWQSADEMLRQLEVPHTPTGGLTPAAGLTPTDTQPVDSGALEAALRKGHPVRVAALFGLAAIGILGLAYGLMMALGLPDWVFLGAVALLAVGLPIIVVTGMLERQRTVLATTGIHVSQEEAPVRRAFTWRKALLGGVAAFAGLVFVAAGYSALKAMGIGPGATLVTRGELDALDRVVLAQFDNLTDDVTLGDDVTELLRIDLEQSPVITLMTPAQINGMLSLMELRADAVIDEPTAMAIAERDGLKAVISGDVRAVGNGYVISGRIVDRGGEALVSVRETAKSADDIVIAVDRLSANLREQIGESLRSIRADPPLNQVTTSSMEALRSYSRGIEARLHGDYGLALQLYEEAAELDTTFAMAWRKIGIMRLIAATDLPLVDSALTKAYQLRDRLTDRERLLAEGSYHQWVTHDLEATERAYRALLDRYPTDAIALVNLGIVYNNQQRIEEAAELQRRSLAAGNRLSATYLGAITSAVALGDVELADSLMTEALRLYPDNPAALQTHGHFLWSTGKYADAEVAWTDLAERRLQSWPGERFSIASASMHQGQLEQAVQQLESAVEFAGPGVRPFLEFWVLLGRAQLAVHFGQEAGELAALETAIQSGSFKATFAALPEATPYEGIVLAFARAGRVERARELRTEYLTEVDSVLRINEQPFTIHGMDGEIAMAEGRYMDAVTAYRTARSRNACPVCYVVELANAFDKAGAVDSAAAYYEQFLTTPQLGRVGSDALGRPASLRRLGELYDQAGDTERALEYYGDFADLWDEADPVLQPQVEEVRQRMAELAGEGSR